MYKVDYILAPLLTVAGCYVAYKLIKDLVQMNENRPAVTDAMVEDAYRCQVMQGFDDEFDDVDWEN